MTIEARQPMSLGAKVITAFLLGPVILLAATVSIVGSLRSAPAAGYEAPPLATTHVLDPKAKPTVERVSEHLSIVDGLRVVHVWGTPYEMGRQHGEAVADAVRGVRDGYLLKHVTEDDDYTRDYQLACAQSMLKHVPEAYVEEMKGVAEGAGVEYEDILLLHTHADMVHYGKNWRAGGLTASEGGEAQECSNFVALGEATADGKTYHGRNLDWTIGTGVQQYAILLIGEPDEGVPFAILTYAGGIGGVTGMNARGITFGEMTSQTAQETLDGLPLFLTCRTILQECENIGEVEEYVSHYPGTTGWNFMIADGGTGDARAFEVDAVHRLAFAPGDPAEDRPPVSTAIPNVLRRTNHPCGAETQAATAERLRLPSLEVARAALPTLDTWERYAAMGQWLGRDYYGKVNAGIARAMLATPPLAAGNTLHSAVFNATDRIMWVANATDDMPAWSQEYIRIDLDDWLTQQ